MVVASPESDDWTQVVADRGEEIVGEARAIRLLSIFLRGAGLALLGGGYLEFRTTSSHIVFRLLGHQMPNLLDILPKLTEADRRHIGLWLNNDPAGKTPSVGEIALQDRARLKHAAQKYFERWFTSYGKSPSSSATSATYDKLFGGDDARGQT